MLTPITIAGQTYSPPLIQGPLAGISCAPFRRLCWQYSQPAYVYTEMLSCKTILYQSPETLRRFITIAPDEGPVCFQLASNDPQELAAAVKRVTDYGAAMIDLNCGCPVNKIRRKGAGSSLLTNPVLLYQLITAMKQNTHLPISVKIRVESNSPEKFNAEVATVINEAGADVLVVHGRHWTEHYETPCQYAEIKYFVDNVKIPVIGNGDVADFISLQKMLATGCSGVMLGRYGVGQPWLLAQLAAEYAGQYFSRPSNAVILSMFLQHVTDLAELLRSEKFAILQARKFAKYYARHLPSRAAFAAAVNTCCDMQSLYAIAQSYFLTEPSTKKVATIGRYLSLP